MNLSPADQLDEQDPSPPVPAATPGHPDEPGGGAGPTSDDVPRRRWRLGTIAAAAACVFIVVMWAFVYIWAAVQRPVDRLDSRAFAVQAERVCAATTAKLDALPPASASQSHQDRAAVVVETDTDLRAMLTELAAIAPKQGNDSRVVHDWLADYGTYVHNRETYAIRLASDPKARFYESEKNPGEQISLPIDDMATANKMPDCVTPGDLS